MDGRGIASAPNLILNGELWEIDSRSRACLYRTSRRVVVDGGGARVIILLFVVAPRPLMSSHDRTLNLIKSVYGVSTPFFLPTTIVPLWDCILFFYRKLDPRIL